MPKGAGHHQITLKGQKPQSRNVGGNQLFSAISGGGPKGIGQSNTVYTVSIKPGGAGGNISNQTLLGIPQASANQTFVVQQS